MPSSSGEGEITFKENLDEVLSQIITSKVNLQKVKQQRISFKSGQKASPAMSADDDNAGRAAIGVEKQHNLNSRIHGRPVEDLELDAPHW
eukprot:CAMPEP_0115094464 /NCGR_PEP_ID=MMETSP0227-20121206/28372_1 /TAXON_ID=89957 /ORGANISM="Polarella glacialis, Strain CCMP 1383" /LENGTH=89 /DNA_ID=CAMNT_0002487469 /DNA_START=555 /DNA_END=824 /DNA_ORIENTATION=-